jgi:hypothetical protein
MSDSRVKTIQHAGAGVSLTIRGGTMRHVLLLTIGCALATAPEGAQAQDHVHPPPDSASVGETRMHMPMPEMMSQMMSAMTHMHEVMCMQAGATGEAHAPTDSLVSDPMAAMGQMMTEMGRMMTMMSRMGAMTHDASPGALPPPTHGADPPRE